MCHPAAHQIVLLRPKGRGREGREVGRFNEAVLAQPSRLTHSAQILYGQGGIYQQGETTGIRRYYERTAACDVQSKTRNTERSILVIAEFVRGAKRSFRDAPRGAALRRVGLLHTHRCLNRTIEQSVWMRSHPDDRHEVFEHGPGPRD